MHLRCGGGRFTGGVTNGPLHEHAFGMIWKQDYSLKLLETPKRLKELESLELLTNVRGAFFLYFGRHGSHDTAVGESAGTQPLTLLRFYPTSGGGVPVLMHQ